MFSLDMTLRDRGTIANYLEFIAESIRQTEEPEGKIWNEEGETIATWTFYVGKKEN